MGFFDDVSTALGGLVKTATGALGAALPAVAGAVGAIRMIINPNTGGMMPMPIQGPAWPPDIAMQVMAGGVAPMMSSTPNYFEGLLRECGSYTGACADDFNRRLIAFSNAVNMGGAGGMAMNASTGSFEINQAGAASAISQLLRNPTVRQIATGLGIGVAADAAIDTVAGLLGMGGGAMARSGPFLMNWPAGTPYPRSITLRAPDKPEKRFRSRGAAILDSGDVTAVRRVQKAASRARKGRRRASSRPMMLVAGGTRAVCGSCLTAPCACNGK